jgi:transposase-like protein
MTGEYRQAHWAGVMRERQESGLSIKAYCEQVGIHENVYYYWQRKLREAACQQLIAVGNGSERIPTGWAICKAENELNENKTAEISGVEIRIGKCEVKVTRGMDEEMLSTVLRMLVALC